MKASLQGPIEQLSLARQILLISFLLHILSTKWLILYQGGSKCLILNLLQILKQSMVCICQKKKWRAKPKKDRSDLSLHIQDSFWSTEVNMVLYDYSCHCYWLALQPKMRTAAFVFILFKKIIMPLFKKQANKTKTNQKSYPNFTDWLSVLRCVCLANHSRHRPAFDVLNFTAELAHAKWERDF